MKKNWLIGLVLLLVAGAAGFLLRDAWDRTVTVNLSQGEINAALAKKFPKDKTYLKIVRVTYLNPRAVLLPDQDKVRVSVDVRVVVGVAGLLGKSYTGSAALITRIGYHPADYQFFLEQPELQSLEAAQLPESYRAALQDGLNHLAGELGDAVPIYQLTKNDTQTNLAKLLLKNVAIHKDKVVVTLGR
ncbi:MAG: DUF1439 domain-containing protein [Verrucomicrobia bacterium]|nr:MAG: DUF1439 domain-containing protein [Verrucomicrobiota bacterium]